MKCDEVELSLDSFLDNQITIPLKTEIERHLFTCAACRNAFENLQVLSASVKTNLVVSAPASLDKSVMLAFHLHHEAKNDAEKHNEPPFVGWFSISRPAFALASIVMIAATSLAFYLGKESALTEATSEPNASTVSQIQNTGEKRLTDLGSPLKNETAATMSTTTVTLPIDKKIVTRTVYITRKPNALHETMSAVNSAEKSQQSDKKVQSKPLYTALDLNGFQPIAEMKIRITKKENQKNDK